MDVLKNRAGHTKRNLSGEAAFHSFVPVDLKAITIEWTSALAKTLAETEHALGALSGHFEALSDEEKGAFVETMLESELDSSWNLSAGRKVGMVEDLFEDLIDLDDELDALDEQEVSDLKRACEYLLEPFDDLPTSKRLLENAHYLMSQSPRYEKKYPGEFRRSPNWIARPDETLATARFVPPMSEDMTAAFSALERYIHDANDEPALARIALAHYQFEMLHPFIDGNGRIGRLLSMRMLIEEGQIPAPILPLSNVLRERAGGYYGNLELVEREGDYEAWVAFFLGALRDAAKRALERL